MSLFYWQDIESLSSSSMRFQEIERLARPTYKLIKKIVGCDESLRGKLKNKQMCQRTQSKNTDPGSFLSMKEGILEYLKRRVSWYSYHQLFPKSNYTSTYFINWGFAPCNAKWLVKASRAEAAVGGEKSTLTTDNKAAVYKKGDMKTRYAYLNYQGYQPVINPVAHRLVFSRNSAQLGTIFCQRMLTLWSFWGNNAVTEVMYISEMFTVTNC